MKKFAVAAAGLAALSACTPSAPTNLVDVNITSRSAQNVVAYDTVEVRTRLRSSGGGSSSEITGVPCSLQGSGFSASFQSPAAVNVPMYQQASRAIQVSCQYEAMTETQTLQPVNLTESRAVSNGQTGAGLIGALLVATVVAARTDRTNDDYGYNNARLVFEN